QLADFVEKATSEPIHAAAILSLFYAPVRRREIALASDEVGFIFQGDTNQGIGGTIDFFFPFILPQGFEFVQQTKQFRIEGFSFIVRDRGVMVMFESGGKVAMNHSFGGSDGFKAGKAEGAKSTDAKTLLHEPENFRSNFLQFVQRFPSDNS